MWSVDTVLPRMHQMRCCQFTVSSMKLFDVDSIFFFYFLYRQRTRGRVSLTPFDVSKYRGEHQSRRPSRRLTFMFNVGDDHKGGGANVPFTVPQFISDPTQGWRAPGKYRGWRGALPRRSGVTADAACFPRLSVVTIKGVNWSHKLPPVLRSAMMNRLC